MAKTETQGIITSNKSMLQMYWQLQHIQLHAQPID
jgi:hypothetical protein